MIRFSGKFCYLVRVTGNFVGAYIDVTAQSDCPQNPEGAKSKKCCIGL